MNRLIITQLDLKQSYNSINIKRLLIDLHSVAYGDEINLNFQGLKFCEIGPLAILMSTIKGWQNKGKQVNILGDHFLCYRYLQRIDFFKSLGIDIKENFTRRASGGQFCTFTSIKGQDSGLASKLADEIAQIIAYPQEEVFEFTDQPHQEDYFESIAYSVSELVKNVQQHSKGSGYITAQYYKSLDKVKIAIFDDGIGVKESFNSNSNRSTSKIHNDIEALRTALLPQVSSKLNNQRSAWSDGTDENAGVGLTLLTEIAVESGGEYYLISGNGFISSSEDYVFDFQVKGTFVHLEFNRQALENFNVLLENAKSTYIDKLDDDLTKSIDSMFK